MKRNKLKFSNVEYRCDDDTTSCTISAWITRKSKPSKGADTHCGKMAVWESEQGNLAYWKPIQGLAETIYNYDTRAVLDVINNENQRWVGCN